MEQWKQNQQWTDDDQLDGWLKLQGLDNSQAIIAKVIEGPVVYANGTRRLWYEKGKFYLDHYFEERTDYGVGKQLDIKALEKRFSNLYPTAEIKVRLNKHPNASALSIAEGTKASKAYTYLIQFNPAKLKGQKQVAQRIAEVEKYLTK